MTVYADPWAAKAGDELAEDKRVFREYHALLVYKFQPREELKRQIERDYIITG